VSGIGKEAAIEVKGLHVSEPSRWAVREVAFSVAPGSLHMILGERDTGKTALLETLAGMRAEERGTVRLGGREVAPKERRRAVRFIPREVPPLSLSVEERLLIVTAPRRAGILLDRRGGRERARAVAARVGLAAPLHVPVETLRPLERRLLELAAALDQEPALLLLDEPTMELGPNEARQFLAALRAAAADAKIPAVLASARPRDAYPDAGGVTILHRGAPSETVRTEEVTETALLERWTGGAGVRRAPSGPHQPGESLLRVEDVVIEGRGRETSLAGLGFEVRAGEVLAIVGAPADGLALLHDVLLGHRTPERGSIQFLGKEMISAPRRHRVDAGMSFVHPPFARDQSVPEFTVEENLILGQTRRGPFGRRGWLRFESIRGNAIRLLSDFEVADARPRDLFRGLPLGSRQRIIVAREVMRNPRVLIVRSPAQGLSLAAQEYVRKALVLQCERGSGLVWLTEEPEEALRVADRLAVLAAGRLQWLNVTETLTREAIVDEMSGAAA
jgi:simple sugar transport system ATP-binding protein